MQGCVYTNRGSLGAQHSRLEPTLIRVSFTYLFFKDRFNSFKQKVLIIGALTTGAAVNRVALQVETVAFEMPKQLAT